MSVLDGAMRLLASRRGETLPLSAVQIFWNFARDTLLTGGIYALLIVITLALKKLANSLQDSRVHHFVVVGLEYMIFFCGSLLVLLILGYVTVISILELARSFRCALNGFSVGAIEAGDEKKAALDIPNTARAAPVDS